MFKILHNIKKPTAKLNNIKKKIFQNKFSRYIIRPQTYLTPSATKNDLNAYKVNNARNTLPLLIGEAPSTLFRHN